MLRSVLVARKQQFTSIKDSSNCLNHICQEYARGTKNRFSSVACRIFQLKENNWLRPISYADLKSQFIPKPSLIDKYRLNSSSADDNEEDFAESQEDNSQSDRNYPLSVTAVIDKDYLSITDVEEFLKEEFAEDICVIKVDVERLKFHYVDYFVVVSGRSVRHLKAMAHGLCRKFKKRVREERGKATAVVEGENCLDWMAVDIGNIVVHFMMPEAREKYELEKLWSLGPEFDEQYQEMLRQDQEEDMLYLFKSKETKPESKLNDSEPIL